MQAGLIVLCAAYVLSQFFRAFLAVLSQVLERDIGAGPEHLAFASGMWFLVFAAMQLPLGWALDRIGPRRTAAVLIAFGCAGGSAFFAAATAPCQISVAMWLIVLCCSPALMASYFIFASMRAANSSKACTRSDNVGLDVAMSALSSATFAAGSGGDQ